jgi:hypothetical protein
VQPLNINLLPLLAQISPSVVNDNTDSPGLLPSDASLLEFSKRETTTLAYFSVVANCLRSNCGTKESEGSDTQRGGFGFACFTSAELPPWLIKPGANPALPVLPEVVVVEDCMRELISQLEGLSPRDLTVIVTETHGLIVE